MKRVLALLLVCCMLLPAAAGAQKTTLRLLGVEEGTIRRGNDPNVRYEQVDFDIWGDPMVWLTRKNADVLVIPADAAQSETALRFLEEWAQSIPWFNQAALFADFAPGEYAYEEGWPVLVSEGWLADYHSWDGVCFCATNVFGTNRAGVTGKEKYLLQFLKKEIAASLFAQRLDGLLE